MPSQFLRIAGIRFLQMQVALLDRTLLFSLLATFSLLSCIPAAAQ
jgi:hypothetical protein